jgi:hypothetical protein
VKTHEDNRVHDLEIDVGSAVDAGTLAHTAVSVFVPPQIGHEAVVAFGFPGGGYNRAGSNATRSSTRCTSGSLASTCL